jgi:hypothetical protein
MEKDVANITRSIELADPVGVVSERWTEFERTPRCDVDEAEARVRWRAEVLTFEPAGDGTRVTLRIDYDPSAGDAGLSRSLERALEAFRAFLAERFAPAAWQAVAAPQDGWRS